MLKDEHVYACLASPLFEKVLKTKGIARLCVKSAVIQHNKEKEAVISYLQLKWAEMRFPYTLLHVWHIRIQTLLMEVWNWTLIICPEILEKQSAESTAMTTLFCLFQGVFHARLLLTDVSIPSSDFYFLTIFI